MVLRKISLKLAAISLAVIVAVVICFHLIVVSGIIPYTIVWGGRLENRSQMLIFEGVSIAVNGFILWLTAQRANWLSTRLSPKLVSLLFWTLAILFMLNTVGNLLAKASLETYLFTPLTFISALLCIRLALKDQERAKPLATNTSR